MGLCRMRTFVLCSGRRATSCRTGPRLRVHVIAVVHTHAHARHPFLRRRDGALARPVQLLFMQHAWSLWTRNGAKAGAGGRVAEKDRALADAVHLFSMSSHEMMSAEHVCLPKTVPGVIAR